MKECWCRECHKTFYKPMELVREYKETKNPFIRDELNYCPECLPNVIDGMIDNFEKVINKWAKKDKQ